jgi:uncharacterized membrane protein YiaA
VNTSAQKPSGAFIGASWTALLLGSVVYLIGLWNSDMGLSEKGFYFTLIMYGLFSAVSLQKTVRDRLENIPVTNIYFGLAWTSLILSLLLLAIGLWNATSLTLSEKGFFGMSYALSLFAAVAVQKNVRDLAAFEAGQPKTISEPRSEQADDEGGFFNLGRKKE